MLRYLPCIVLAAAAWATPASVLAASPNCATEGGQLLSWPAGDPVWEMCWLGPDSSIGPRGSGLELRAVHYRGIPVARRIHAPMLFAEYRSSTCYRDWKDDDTPTLAHTSTHNQLGTPPDLNRLAATSCSVSQHPTQSYGACPHQQQTGNGYQCSTGQNVIIEDLGDHVRFVSQYRADWYMYDSRISFFADGDIEPIFGFGNNNGTFNSTTHWHHNYWRFDFDIDGEPVNRVSINGVDQTVEFHDLRGEPGSTTWEVHNPDTGRGYRLVPGADDYTVPTNDSGRGFHMVDFMATQYRQNEYGDNPNYSLGDCGMNEDALVNGESIANNDVVLWYRVAVRDTTSNDWPPGCGGAGNPCLPQDSMICKTAGPRLEPIGTWGEPAEDADLAVAVAATPAVPIGGALTLDIDVDNLGPQTVDDATVTVDLPVGVAFAEAEGTWDCEADGTTVTCAYTGAGIAAGGSGALQLVAGVGDADEGMAQVVVAVESTQWNDPQADNDTATASFVIEPDPLDLVFRHDFEMPVD